MEKLSKEDLKKLAEIDPELAKLYRRIQRLEESDASIEGKFREGIVAMSKKFDKAGFEIMPQLRVAKAGKAVQALKDRRAVVRCSIMSYKRNPEYFEPSLFKAFVKLTHIKYGLSESEIARRVKGEPEKVEEFPKSFKKYEYSCDCHKRLVSSKHHHRIKRGAMRIHCEKCQTDFAFTGNVIEITPKYVAKEDLGPVPSYNVIENTPEHPIRLGAAIEGLQSILAKLKCKREDIVFI